jgi:hypothetical protein
MMNTPGGYSWLGISPEPKNVPLTEKEINRLDKEVNSMENAAILLEGKIRRYHELCKIYETEAGTKRGVDIYRQLETLKKEIQYLSKEISRSLEESSEITRLEDL